MSCLCEVHRKSHSMWWDASCAMYHRFSQIKHTNLLYMHINANPTQHFLQNNVTWDSFAMSSDCGYIQNTYVFRLQSMHLSLDPNRPLKQSRMTQHHPVQNQDLSPGGPRTHKMQGEKRAVSCIYKVYNLPKFDWFILGHWFWSSIFALLSTS